jgi:hypothetical protein
LGFQYEDNIARWTTRLGRSGEFESLVIGGGSTYLLVSGACENNALAICHPTLYVNLLPIFFLDNFLSLAFLASLSFSKYQIVSPQFSNLPILLTQDLPRAMTVVA